MIKISLTTQTASKDYSCDACLILLELLSTEDITPSEPEQEDWAYALHTGFQIKEHTPYIKLVYKESGSVHTFRAIPEIYKIIEEYL